MTIADIRPTEVGPTDPAADLPADISPAAAVRELSRRFPDRCALVYEGRSIDFRELADTVRRLAGVLADGGVGRGDRVGYLGQNSPAFLTTYLAAARLGAVFVPVNSRLVAEEVRQVVTDCAAH